MKRTWVAILKGECSDLQGLGDEHALHKGHSCGHEPPERAGPSVVQAVEHSEEGRHAAGGHHQEPAHQDTPPGQAASRLAGPRSAAKEERALQSGWHPKTHDQLPLCLHPPGDLRQAA